MKKLWSICLLCCFCWQFATADYLIAYKDSRLKQQPNAQSEWLLGAMAYKGEMLEMLNDGKQTNAYYKVRVAGTNIKGYIYRGQVKRVKGILPQFYAKHAGVDVHVVDVGAGLGCIIKTPSGRYIVYDGGNGNWVYKYLKSLHPDGDIAFLIASHTDWDHWGSIKKLVQQYQVNSALITSFRPGNMPKGIQEAMDALRNEPNSTLVDLATHPIKPGTEVFKEGAFSLRFLSGFGKEKAVYTSDLGDNSSSVLRNAASIVIKLTYQENSVLFMGDAAGLKECPKSACDCEQQCIGTERFMLDSISAYLQSRVIIAGHHGARDASCPAFIQAVNPDFVVFSAGNKYHHPHFATVANYHTYAGVATENMFRTDIGLPIKDIDDDPCNNEWVGGNKNLTIKDDSFDDHVRIQFTEHGRVLIGNVKKVE